MDASGHVAVTSAGDRATTLAALIAPLARHGVLVGVRAIAAGDEFALFPEEMDGFRYAAPAVRRQSGAARLAARDLLTRLGVAPVAIPRNASRAPVWPVGVTGSLAHEAGVAVAAVARASDLRSLGIDIEPAAPLPASLAARVATPAERRRMPDPAWDAARLFVVKEAVYKAVHPVDGQFLDFCDIDVDFAAGVAVTGSGRRVRFDVVTGSHIVALAWIDRHAR